MFSKVFSGLGKAARKTAGNPRDALLGIRMAAWVVLISVLARLTSLPRAQRIVSFKVRSRSVKAASESPEQLGIMIDNILGLDLLVFRRSCWKRAMVLHRFLALNGIDSQINFGLRKEGDGKVNGHAWLEHKGQPLLENDAGNYIVTFSLPRDRAVFPAKERSFIASEPTSR